ncbi:TonB-dependent siderophore receptor [Acinetobacter wuhouensis]|uniref:TonB-dependent siderophore receptor n=1 Tax=Acinetobacter wuhouensis TaxID=1879050 RepID=A0A3G2T0K9_9GAMM|nr:TonB-dependent siderophore receptor [Acinetobacter wuhouensis]AYO53674.1 TonB-dependent siderophore receptor [Acinetobacter wuhouensis]
MKHTGFKASLLSRAIRHSLLSAIVLSASTSTVSVFAGTVSIQNVQIASGPLAQVVNQFAEQAGILLTYDAKLLEGKQSADLKGSYNLDSGFIALLSKHNLQLQKTTTGYSIVAQAQQQTRDVGQLQTIDVTATTSKNRNVAQLPVITVSADSNTTEGTDSYTTRKMRTATKLNLSIRETPQSVTVISNQLIEDKKIDDFDTLMKNVTGVGADKGVQDNRAYYTLRGVDLDYYQMDGIPMPTSIYAMNNYNMDKFDRVEIVKGANGLTNGAGNPAGAINLVRKHADSKIFTGSIDASAGTWDTYKIKADLSTPLNEDGSVRGRLVTSHKETDTFKDRVHDENDLVYAVIDADLTDRTTISAGASYEKEKIDGDSSNLPAFYSDGTKTNFSRSKNYSSDWSYWNSERYSYFIGIKQYLAYDILLNAIYSHNDIKNDNHYGYIDVWTGSLNKDGSGLKYQDFGNNVQDIKEDNFDIYGSIPFNFLNREHEIVSGFQYNRQKINTQIKTLGTSHTINNFFTQNGSEVPLSDTLNPQPKYEDIDAKQAAFYLTGRFEIVKDLKLIAGGRFTNYKYDVWNKYDGYSNYDFNNEFTPFVGLTYDINKNHSIYASYTDIFKPQNARDKDNKLLDPILGKNYEIGVKGEYFDQRLNAGVTLFRIEQDNYAENTYEKNSVGNYIYLAKDGVTSKGIELEVAGKLTENWDLSAGFVNFEIKQEGEKINTKAPRSNINIFSKYSINDFSLGAGINWKSDGYKGSGVKKVTQDAYATVDIMASYNISKNLTGQLNINNLFDKTYYSGYSAYEYSYAEPINGMLSLKYQF